MKCFSVVELCSERFLIKSIYWFDRQTDSQTDEQTDKKKIDWQKYI